MRFISSFIVITFGLLLSFIVSAQETIVKELPVAPHAPAHVAAPAVAIPHHEKIDLNKASAQELLSVKGLNTSKVRAIIVFRKKNNGFKSLEELSQVKGMKRLKPEEMKMIQNQLKL